MRGRVAQDRQALVAVEAHCLDDIAVGNDVSQVAQLSIDPRHEGALVLGKELSGRCSRRYRSLASSDDHGDVGRHCDSFETGGYAARPRGMWAGCSMEVVDVKGLEPLTSRV